MKSHYRIHPSIAFSKLILLILCLYGTTDYCLPKEMVEYTNKLHGGKNIYLTNISLYFTLITLFMGYLVRYCNYKSLTATYKNTLSVILPLEALVTSLFWILFFIDPSLLRVKELIDQGVEVSILSDLAMHLFPFLALVLDSLDVFLYRDTIHIISLGVFSIIYYLMCNYFAGLNGAWVYPFLDNLTFVYRTLFFAVSTLIAVGMYELSMKIFKYRDMRILNYNMSK